jgi:hypothetical protein
MAKALFLSVRVVMAKAYLDWNWKANGMLLPDGLKAI